MLSILAGEIRRTVEGKRGVYWERRISPLHPQAFHFIAKTTLTESISGVALKGFAIAVGVSGVFLLFFSPFL